MFESLFQQILAEQKKTNELLQVIVSNSEQKVKLAENSKSNRPITVEEKFNNWDEWKDEYEL
ncbi:hypothetical protein K5E_25280 [Enterococcus thailandicus]|uniref:hypothetical protein n=1 Tax=Enterococcus TaxID=1350 RepID=UPI0022E973F1|nr:hypothetical protein [Enterococcus thailandicus]GMC10389.1 hypothetical protein K5E_25280 [Enterococcus thailandicus]